jgi:hypothetical protein
MSERNCRKFVFLGGKLVVGDVISSGEDEYHHYDLFVRLVDAGATGTPDDGCLGWLDAEGQSCLVVRFAVLNDACQPDEVKRAAHQALREWGLSNGYEIRLARPETPDDPGVQP